MKRHGRRPKRSCNGKRRYRDHQEAARALATIRTHGDRRDKLPVRAYECPRCNGWHLTSQDRA